MNRQMSRQEDIEQQWGVEQAEEQAESRFGALSRQGSVEQPAE